MSVQAYIGLGSNLAEPVQQIRHALQALAKLPATTLLSDSGLFKSAPMGPQDQPDYINAAALLETDLPALELLDQLQAIEQQQGRVRLRHWGERTLDLDILLYGNEIIQDARLNVPHIGLAEREFVLYPLQKITPDLVVPGKGKLSDMIKACAKTGIEYIGSVNE
jgi:2-amino-4-hydroxy-6-hydroxymethyldihydropteridine diphosphokinase